MPGRTPRPGEDSREEYKAADLDFARAAALMPNADLSMWRAEGHVRVAIWSEKAGERTRALDEYRAAVVRYEEAGRFDLGLKPKIEPLLLVPRQRFTDLSPN